MAVFPSSLMSKYIQGYFIDVFIKQAVKDKVIVLGKDSYIRDPSNKEQITAEYIKYVESFIKLNKLQKVERLIQSKLIKESIKSGKPTKKNPNGDIKSGIKREQLSQFIFNELSEKTAISYTQVVPRDKEATPINGQTKYKLVFETELKYDEEYNNLLARYFNSVNKFVKTICKSVFNKIIASQKTKQYEAKFDTDNKNLLTFSILSKDFTKFVTEQVDAELNAIKAIKESPNATEEEKRKRRFLLTQASIDNIDTLMKQINEYKPQAKSTAKIEVSMMKLIQLLNQHLRSID